MTLPQTNLSTLSLWVKLAHCMHKIGPKTVLISQSLVVVGFNLIFIYLCFSISELSPFAGYLNFPCSQQYWFRKDSLPE